MIYVVMHIDNLRRRGGLYPPIRSDSIRQNGLARLSEVPFGPMVRDMVKAQLELEEKKEPTQLDKIEKKIDKLLSRKSAIH